MKVLLALAMTAGLAAVTGCDSGAAAPQTAPATALENNLAADKAPDPARDKARHPKDGATAKPQPTLAGGQPAKQVAAAEPPKPDEPRKDAGTKTVELDLGGGVKLKMASIPAKGKTFWMGSPRTEKQRNYDEEQHEVHFSRDYWLGVTTVTQAQWLAVMGGKNPSFFSKDGAGARAAKDLNTDAFPVEQVNWEEAKAFCDKLQEKLKDGHAYRLPTEAEWEFACRGGDQSKDSLPFYLRNGATAALSAGQVNFWSKYPYGGGKKGTALDRTAAVASHPDAVNAFGLYDMQGNVQQWCGDWYEAYPKEKATDPAGPEKTAMWELGTELSAYLPRDRSTTVFKKS